MKMIKAGVLDIAYLDHGPADGPPVVLLHGFPYDIHAYDDVSRLLAARGLRCLTPFLRGYGETRFLNADTPRSGEQAALGADLLAFMDALAIPRAILGGYDWGGRAACIVAALWPERVAGLVSCGQGYNIQDIVNAEKPAAPEAEARWWYVYYFNTARGVAALTQDRRALCRDLWRLWSPSWTFDDATFAATAASFDNRDFVDVVIHSYRHRLGGVEADPAYQDIEARLARQPDIAAPTIVLQGRDDGVDPPGSQDAARAHFTGRYEKRIIPGTGHNLPQEAPDAFVSAVLSFVG